MARPRHSIEDADLTGLSDRWTPEQRAEREEAERAGITEDQKTEVAKLDSLIAEAMKACQRGQKLRGKRNPAFQNLATLVKARKMVLDTKRSNHARQSANDLIAEAEALIAKVN
jgi:hypothetical protein